MGFHQCRCPGDPCQPLGFFSKKFDHAQISYCAFNRELLAAFSAIHHFRFQVESRQFQLWKDHRLQPSLSPSHIAGRPVEPHQLPASIPTALVDSSFVYARCGGAKSPLSPAYSGPFAVISRFPKYFILDLGDRRSHLAWSSSSHILGQPFSHGPVPLAAASLSSQMAPAPGAPLGWE